MNAFGTAVVGIAIQVSIVAVFAHLAYAWAARRGPRTGAFVLLLTFVAILLVVPMTWCPLPVWLHGPSRGNDASETEEISQGRFNDDPNSAGEVIANRGDDHSAPSQAIGGGIALRSFFHRDWKKAWQRLHHVPDDSQWGWQGLVGMGFLIGTGFFLARLGIGLCTVHSYRRNSQLIEDQVLTDMLASMASDLGFRRSIEIREYARLTGPATIGWRHPVIFLPSNWRSWNEIQRRAVLAHELAHVTRLDFAAGVMARIAVAVHFYHPLIWRLACRLQLLQELAADNLGARLAGGRSSYLVALSQMALQQEGRFLVRPAPSFLTDRGTLMRRIVMLRRNDRTAERPLSRLGRWICIGFVTALALGVSTLRGPAQTSGKGSVGKPGAKMVESVSKIPPLDYSLVLPLNKETVQSPELIWQKEEESEKSNGAANAKVNAESKRQSQISVEGVLSIRPSVILSQPGMKRIADKIDKDLHEVFRSFNDADNKIDLPVIKIEQIASRFLVLTQIPCHGEKLEHPNEVITHSYMIRTIEPFDWKRHFLKYAPKSQEFTWEGKKYYRLKPETYPMPLLTANYFLIQDDRTIVFDTEDCLKRLIHGERAGKDSYPWTKDWKAIESGVMALAVQNKNQKLVSQFAKNSDSPEAKVIFDNVDQLIVAANLAKGYSFDATFKSSTKTGAKSIEGSIKALVALALKEWNGKAPNEGSNLFIELVTKKMLEQAKIDSNGPETSFHMETDIPLAELIAKLLAT